MLARMYSLKSENYCRVVFSSHFITRTSGGSNLNVDVSYVVKNMRGDRSRTLSVVSETAATADP